MEGRFRRPISIAIPDKPTPQQEAVARKRAEDALRQAKAATNYEQFGMLAEKLSEDDWHVMMGDHKEISRVEMKTGQMTELIRTEHSWYILRVTGRQDPHQAGYEQVKDSLKKELQASKIETLRHSPRTAPVGSRIKLRRPMPITSVTSFMISAPNDFAF